MELYGVFSDTVHLPDYPADETLMILKTFGYSTLSDVQQEYGEEAYRQIIAECIFEHHLPLRDEPIYHGTEEDVVAFIKEITEEKTDV